MKKNGRIPAAEDFKNKSTYIKYFESWNKAIIATGFEPRKTYNEQTCIEKIQQWAHERDGLPPTVADFSNNPYFPNFRTVTNLFGTWDKAIIIAGFEHSKSGPEAIYTKESCIEYIQQWAKKHNGIPPSISDFNCNAKYPSSGTVINLFGTWSKAIIVAGFIPNDSVTRGRHGEVQTIQEFKTEGAIDLAGKNIHSPCDGICPNGKLYDTKSASIIKRGIYWCWAFNISIEQLEKADYLILRAYETKDFTKKPMHKWIVPIQTIKEKRKDIESRTAIFIYKENRGNLNVENMSKYEIKDYEI